MLKGGDDGDLADEPPGLGGRRELGAKHLEGHEPVVFEVAREVDAGGFAAAQRPLDPVALAGGRVGRDRDGGRSEIGWRIPRARGSRLGLRLRSKSLEEGPELGAGRDRQLLPEQEFVLLGHAKCRGAVPRAG